MRRERAHTAQFVPQSIRERSQQGEGEREAAPRRGGQVSLASLPFFMPFPLLFDVRGSPEVTRMTPVIHPAHSARGLFEV